MRPFDGTEPSCPTQNACYVLGYRGVGGETTALGLFNGQDLKVIASAPAGAEAVSCPTTAFCMTVSVAADTSIKKDFRYPAPVSATWSNGRWHRQAIPALPTAAPSGTGKGQVGVSWALRALSCASPDSCWAVGGTSDDPDDATQPPSSPLIERWNGRRWSRARADARIGTLTSISCPSVGTCVAVGAQYEGATQYGTGLVDATPEVLRGHHWAAVAPPGLPGTIQDTLTSVSCSTVTRCVAVGSAATGTSNHPYPYVGEIATWNGTSWASSALARRTGDVQAGKSEALNYVSCPPGQDTTCLSTASHGLDSPRVGMLTVIPAQGAPASRPRSLAHTGNVGVTCASESRCLVMAEFALLETEPTKP
jgi:hypothetical protein